MNEKHRKIIDEFIEKTSIQSVKLTAVRETCGLTDSKFGGKPYFPKNMEYPKNKNGEPLRLLAQLNFNELPPLDGFLQNGILQFYIELEDDGGYGWDFYNPTNQNSFRIIYHSDIFPESSVDVPEFKDEFRDDQFPFEGEFALKAEYQSCPMTASDFRFDKEFMNTYRKHIETNEPSPYKLGDDIEDAIDDELDLKGHRIGGYPYFTQSDIRQDNLELSSHTVVLLQIDSQEGAGFCEWDIIWGDVGIANFFIKLEDLVKLDFSNVLYNWDCG